MHSRILLVEDDPNDVELTLSALATNNLANDVDVVRDGAEALDYLYRRGAYALRKGDNPIVMFLDLKLPKVEGLEVLERVKTDPHLKTIPVVVLTSSSEHKDLMRGYAKGTNAYVVKPVEFHPFAEAVRELGLFWAIINHPPPESASQ